MGEEGVGGTVVQGGTLDLFGRVSEQIDEDLGSNVDVQSPVITITETRLSAVRVVLRNDRCVGLAVAGHLPVGGYSVQQVRDLEHLGVIPPAVRQPNGYRQFTGIHATALRAYRHLAIAVGPTAAREAMCKTRQLPFDEAIARIVALHVGLARDRDDTAAALHALNEIVKETAHDALAAPADAMSITELSIALGVPSSTLRFWERHGLITPDREQPLSTRRYPPDAVRDARIVAALRAGGYRIPAVQSVMTFLRALGNTADARTALQDRLHNIAARAGALLRAGTDLANLLVPPTVNSVMASNS